MKRLTISIYLILITLIVSGQWECRSKLGAHLKPFYKDFPLMWALEFTGGHGYMNDRDITNVMFFLGLDYKHKNHEIYLEGGRKAWHNSLGAPSNYNSTRVSDNYFQVKRFGIREGFYRYTKDNTSFTAGFFSMNFGDYFLVNERGLGLKYINTFGNFSLQATAASVLKQFSRFGTFCSVHYLYNIIPETNSAYLGESIGETNFAGAILKWKPNNNNDNEFNEFGTSKESIFKEAGLLYYQELGSGVDELSIHYGFTAQWLFPLKINLESELLHQYKNNNQDIIYYLKAYKQFNYGKYGQTIIALGYFGDYKIDDNALPYTSFSNLFIGEVMRMDIMDMPLYQLSAKHRIPKWKTQFKIQATKQFTNQHISEYDLAIGKTFFNNAKFTIMACRMDADILNEIYYMLRGELRITL
ncbi:MAG: hypothetical protein Kow0068_08530 [Marinilabiliales bacterium]